MTNLLGTNKRHEETNYCAFYDGKKFNYAESGLKLFHFLYVRWWIQNVKCQTSNHVTDSSDQKLSVVPSLPKFRVSQTFIHILFLFYFVKTPCIIFKKPDKTTHKHACSLKFPDLVLIEITVTFVNLKWHGN